MKEDQFRQLLEASNGTLFGQLSQHFDEQISALRTELKGDTERIYRTLDAIAKRLETDEQERAAVNAEQERQNGWIEQLAQATNTNLVPDQ
jgi:hypothetical protein